MKNSAKIIDVDDKFIESGRQVDYAVAMLDQGIRICVARRKPCPESGGPSFDVGRVDPNVVSVHSGSRAPFDAEILIAPITKPEEGFRCKAGPIHDPDVNVKLL